MNSYETTVELLLAGEEVSMKVEVQFDYEPEQKEIIHPVDISQEGIPESVAIFSILADPLTDSTPIDIYYMVSPEMMESLEIDVLRYLKAQKENH